MNRASIPNSVVISVLDGVANFLDLEIAKKRHKGHSADHLEDEKEAILCARDFIVANRKV